MPFYADLHVHSKYSRATSKDADLEGLAVWAQRKGIAVVGTGDFTHPAWFAELREKLEPAEPGLFRLRPEIERAVEERVPASCRRPVRFMLEVEISTIYKKGEHTRKIHHLIYAPDFDTASRFRDRLGRIGNIESDGRPILGLDSRDLLEVTLESGPDAYLVPAHIWTPWFAVLGSKSGFDAVEECYGDLADHIFAVETGLSSDPPMNWRVASLDRYRLVSNSDAHSPPKLGREACVFDSDLDYFAMRRALETGEGYGGTVEFFPEEGKYHLDGHRSCGVRLTPEETRRHDGTCPQCGKPVTVGVLSRVDALADRAEGETADGRDPFRSLVPLPEIVGELRGVGAGTKTVRRVVEELLGRWGPELSLLEALPPDDVERSGDPLLAEALTRLRQGKVIREAGYDGEYGTIRLFEPNELDRQASLSLFGADPTPATTAPEPEGSAPEPASARPASVPAVGRSPETPVAPGVKAEAIAGLDPEQRAAAEILHGPLLVVAGPGTGKTRTLTHRVARLVETATAAPEECLTVTFTRRAAAEMRERLEALLPAVASRIPVTTFHGLGLTILRERPEAAGLESGFRVAGQAEVRRVVREAFGVGDREADRLLETVSRSRRQAAEKAADEAKSNDSGGAIDPPPRSSPPTGDEQPSRYEEALRTRSLVDFDDLLLLPLRLLAADPSLRDELRQRWRWISIDEYQDIDPLQYRLVRLLVPAEANLCAVGDPDQSIYGFRGAEVGFFLRFRQDYPEARVVHLTRNYRSVPVIVEAALQAVAPGSLVQGRGLSAVQEAAPERVVLHEAATAAAEAEHVVHTIERLLGGTSYFSLDSGRVDAGDGLELSFSDIAVLYRTHGQAAPLVEALERSGIPFQQRSHRRLAEHPGVPPLLEELQNPAADVGTSVRERLTAALERVHERDPTATMAAQAADLLAPLAERHDDDLEGFLAEVALESEVDTWDPRADRVSLLTLHAAKGLQFPIVFLTGCEDGLLPLRWGRSRASDIDEERRLLFVGMTRAGTRLYLSYARQRTIFGGMRAGGPSPFLNDVAEELMERRRGKRKSRGASGDGASDSREGTQLELL